MLPDERIVRTFFRREVDELAEYQEVFGATRRLAPLVAFTRMLERDDIEVKHLFRCTDEGFLGTTEITRPLKERITVAYEHREEVVVAGVALVRLRWAAGLGAAFAVERDSDGNVKLSISVDRRRLARLSEVVAWFQRLMELHNPLKRRALSLTENGELRFLPPQRVEREDVVLPDGLLEGFERDLGFLEEPDAYPRHLRHRSVILAGEPGLGKTLVCRWLSNRFPATTLWVTPGAVKTVGPANVLRLARELQPTLLILEDLDVAAGSRVQGPLGDLLSQLDGFEDMEGIAILATTNHPEALDEALDPRTRPGRFHRLVTLERPDTSLRRRLTAGLVARSDILTPAGDPLVARLTEITDGMTAAQVCNVVHDLELHLVDLHRTGESTDPLSVLDLILDLRQERTRVGFASVGG